MRIAIDVRPLLHKERTGVGEYTGELLREMIAQADVNDEIVLCYNSFRDVSISINDFEQSNVHIVATRWPNKIFHFLVWLRIIKLDGFFLRAYKRQSKNKHVRFDVFLFPNIHFNSVSKYIPVVQILHDVTFLTQKHTYSLKRRIWHYVLGITHMCQRAQAVVVPSHNTKRDCIRELGIDPATIYVCPPGVSTLYRKEVTEDIIFITKKKYHIDGPYILALGTLEPRKNMQALLEAFRMSRAAQKGYTLVIAGARGWRDKNILADIASTRGAIYLGYVDAKDKPALYAGATVFAYPSVYEGFGLPVLEAMASGTPVITSNRSSLPEVGGSTVYYIHPDNIHSLCVGLQRLCAHGALRDYYIKQAKKRADRFSWKDTAHRVRTLLQTYENRD